MHTMVLVGEFKVCAKEALGLDNSRCFSADRLDSDCVVGRELADYQ